ncbi:MULTISPECIES: SOS response-associated peptidase [Asticcacaulis]|uniref:SOS response-associated peptidase n=1 Tax=Asticcacaulis TaxID=76890 RepID=UPI001AEACC87|nr:MULTISPECIES: SOS response-associated peptidase family protein [Asticcacaulis]MBP2159114.1 putative SOS response-associated peptidase YedK [Asticcacaulis solisilvae]MDR6800159.1 putative SOS response-associated peptidase YedK [Asticcacaulis sp. BE141]
MCGRYGGPKEHEVFSGYLAVPPPFRNLKLQETEMLAARTVQVYARNQAGEHVLKEMRWGLIPPSHVLAPELYDGNTFHARLETVHEKPAYREAWLKKRRCLFPMAHFQQKVKAGSDLFGRTDKTVKLNITRADDRPMGVAGIYSAIKTPAGLVLSVAMLTRAPGPRMLKIHDREPVVIEPEQFSAWLDGEDDIGLAEPWADNAFDYKLVA